MKRPVSPGRMLCLGCLLCLSSLALGATAQQDDVAARVGGLLERMAAALHSLSYEGTLVYLHENRLETLHLMHLVDGGRVHERLVSLSGPVRALTREPERVTCVLRDGHPMSVERTGGGNQLIDTDGIDPTQLGEHYHVEVFGESRVAGRDTDVVGIVPRDSLRYGYRFYIDRETALPLKSDLIDRSEYPLEQLMFASVSFHPSDGSVPEPVSEVVRSAPQTEAPPRWRFDDPPAGFQLVLRQEITRPDGVQFDHFVFTDRLSSYSIYIEPDPRDGLDGSTSIGAVHAAGRRIGGYQVTVVGEVPEATVQAALDGIARVPEGSER